MPHSDPLANLVTGYPKLAGQMGLLPETGIFRRFGTLNAQNLLYLQAEIIHLENKLRKVELSDKQSIDGKNARFSVDWYELSKTARGSDNNNSDQWQKVLELRGKLKEYSMADRKSIILDSS
jgi:hypothetical protein